MLHGRTGFLLLKMHSKSSLNFFEGLQVVVHHPDLIIPCWPDRSDRTRLKSYSPSYRDRAGGICYPLSRSSESFRYWHRRCLRREGNLQFVRVLDALDGTPMINTIPYSPAPDSIKD